MQRNKGKRFERWVANKIRAATGLGIDVVKVGWQSRGGGKEEPDVTLPGWHVECKHMKQCNPRAALRQAVRDIGKKAGIIPVAVTKDDRCSPLVTLHFEDWLSLIGDKESEDNVR